MAKKRARLLATLGALLIAIDVASVAEDAAARDFALRVGRVHTVTDGVIDDATIVVLDGKIAALGREVPIPDGVEVHHLPGHVVLPGLVDAETNLASDSRDTTSTVAPEVRAIDAWDWFAELDGALRGGVTTIYLAPGVAPVSATRLVSGRGAVLKTAGHDLDPRRRIVREALGVQVTLGELARSQPSVWDPPVGASPDNPFEVIERPLPQSRPGGFLALRSALTAAGAYGDAARAAIEGSAPPPQLDPRLGALLPLLAGKDHLRVRVNKARDIYHVLEMARAFDLRVVIEGGAEAERLAPWLVELDVPVIVPGAFRPGQLEGGDLVSPTLEGRVDDEGVLRLVASGVRVILSSPTDAQVKDLLLQAATAVRFGMAPEVALASITSGPAKVLGVADRVGSIRVGADADLIVLGDDPFARRATPHSVIVDGEAVWEIAPEVAADSTVLRCGRIVTGDGRDIRNGIIVMRDGKIDYVGPGGLLRGRPSRVIDASAHTVVPGWIDAGGTAGLRAEALVPGLGVPSETAGASSRASLRLVDSIDPRDPSLLELVRAGITTAVIAPPPGGSASGQVSVLKLAARDPEKAVLKEYAGMYFGGTSTRTLQAAKKYHDDRRALEAKRDEALRKGEKAEDLPPANEELEAYRALYEKRVPAIVEASTRAAVDGLLKTYRDEQGMRVILAGLQGVRSAEDLDAVAEAIRTRSEGVLLQTPFVIESDRRTVHWPRELSRRGVVPAIRSRVAAGARLLPLQVAYAVREGWELERAVEASSVVPARLFGVADRVGSIAKGRDADLVILSGTPFSISTRVVGVLVEGRIVHGQEELGNGDD